MTRRPAPLRRFLRDERGVISAWSLFLFMTVGAIGAAAVDITHFFAARTQLQAAADTAAHAALVNFRRGDSATQARADAVMVAEYAMPDSLYNDVIDVPTQDILFGSYNQTTDVFYPLTEAELTSAGASARTTAVLVTTERYEASGNPVSTLLFRLAGVSQMDVGASSVMITRQPPCLRGGFVAEVRVWIRSNNSFFDGFCMHSNGYVTLQNGNFYETGTTVSMPDLDDLDIPNSGFEQNEGLAEALRESEFGVRILDKVADGSLDSDISALGTSNSPWYLTNATRLALSTSSPTPSSFLPGRVYTRTCSGNQSITFGAGTYSQFVLLTNCKVNFSGWTTLEDVIISTTNDAADSFQTPSGQNNGLQIGKNDSCAPRGGAQLITRGGFKGAAKVDFYDGQILAVRNVEFTSNSIGIGASVISGGTIEARSNMSFSLCPEEPEENLEVDYFVLAR